MIKVNELRIGNIVRGDAIHADKTGIRAIEFCGKILEISSVEPRIKVLKTDNTGYLYASDCMLSGVPLTEEILLKCGFKNRSIGSDFWFECNEIIIGGTGKSFYPSVSGESGLEAYGGEIKFLHQLQNLYFVLTGQELTVNI